jgi:cell wall-associated NlpC family hydrolase
VTEREKVVRYCEWGIANADKIHYGPVRPISFAHPQRLPLVTDCSGFAMLAYAYAGHRLDDDGAGFTGTLMRKGKLVKVPQPADLIFYGEYPGHHVTIFLYEFHGAWVVCSHGQEIGPLRILNHREEIAQGNAPMQIRSYLPRT